jgi:large subunit ribosomal protein L10
MKIMPTPEKENKVAALTKLLDEKSTFIFTDYKGLSVKEITNLRTALIEKGSVYYVVKNNLFRIALEGKKIEGLDEFLVGPTAVAFTSEDVVEAAKALKNYKKDIGKLELKGGYVEGEAVSSKTIEAYADLPAKEVLYSQFLGGLLAPVTGVVRCLNDPLSKLARALQAISEKSE